MRPLRSLDEAAAFVERAGIAIVYSKADIVLPTLWDAVSGGKPLEWSVRDDGGKFVSFTPEFGRLWRWKDELPEKRLACAGRHFGSFAALVSPKLLAAVYALSGRAGRPDDFRELELSAVEREVAEAVLAGGPLTAPELREQIAADKKAVDKAVRRLQRQLVLTNAGVVRHEQGWPAIANDLLARRWRKNLRRLPSAGDARLAVAAVVLAGAGELSAADLAAAVGWRRREATEALDELAEKGGANYLEDDGIRLWTPA